MALGVRRLPVDVPGVHLVTAFAPHAQAVLARIGVDAKTGDD